MECERFLRAVQLVRGFSLNPFQSQLAAVEINRLAKSITVYPARRHGEELLPSDTFIDGDVVLSQRSEKPAFRGRLIRVDESHQCFQIDWISGRELEVHDTIKIFPPDYLRCLEDWIETKVESEEPLPGLYLDLLSERWPSGKYQDDVVEELEPYTDILRERQKDALRVARKRLGIIWGPPGTGKTFTVGAIVNSHRLEGRKILVLGPTHRAVDALVLAIDDLAKLSGFPLDDAELIRIGKAQHPEFAKKERKHLLRFEETLAEIHNEIVRLMDRLSQLQREMTVREGRDPTLEAEFARVRRELDESRDRQQSILERMLPESNIVAVTLASLLARPLLIHNVWDLVVLDEASLVSAALIAFILDLDSHQWLIAGDPMQLRPIYQEPAFARNQRSRRRLYLDAKGLFGENLFDKMKVGTDFLNNRNEVLFKAGVMVRLNEQSRMNSSLCRFIGRTFYEGDLQVVGNPPEPNWPEPWPDKPRVVVDRRFTVPPSYFPEPKSAVRNSTSPSNVCAARITAGVVFGLCSMIDGTDKTMIVLSPFRNQAKLLRNLLAGVEHIEVSTIHRCQGSEATVVVFDPVQASHWFLRQSREAARLWNVAVSRARMQVYIVEDPDTLETNPYVREFLTCARKWCPVWNEIRFPGKS